MNYLAYHNVPREVLRFTLYDDVLYFDDVFQFDSRRFAVMNMRFIANLGEYETELIEMSRDATGITAATGPKKPVRKPKVIIDKPQEVETLIGLGSVNKRLTLKIGLDYETNPKTKFNSKNTASGKATEFGTLLRSADNMTGNIGFVLPEADGSNGDVLTTNGSGVMSFTTPSGGGGDENTFNISFSAALNSGNYYYGNLSYGWSWVVWNSFDSDMNLHHSNQMSGMPAIADFTKISLFGHAACITTGQTPTVNYSLWKAARVTSGNNSPTQIANGDINFSSSAVYFEIDISATGLSITKGDLIFLALKDTSYSANKTIRSSLSIRMHN